MEVNYRKEGQAKFSAASAEGQLKRLDGEWMRFEKLYLEFLQLVPAHAKSIMPYFTEETFEKVQENYWASCDFFADVAAKCTATSAAQPSPTPAPTGDSISVAKLARIPLPKVAVSYAEWHSFRDLFKSLVLDNKSLTNVKRLHYLKSSAEGHAANLIAHFSITDANFEPAWMTLADRYNNKRVIVSTLLSNFVSLPVIGSESADELSRLRDTTKESIAMLRSIGRPVDTWDDVIVFLLTAKLDRQTTSATLVTC
ncbi:uncharacterized protein LOC143350689 [Colletes latitarsis]|uniref:uncharacterized protein LOC143350689 n=1 Tax=Colletes latitarsis TaxID=2605962 RepID=UPI004036FB94